MKWVETACGLANACGSRHPDIHPLRNFLRLTRVRRFTQDKLRETNNDLEFARREEQRNVRAGSRNNVISGAVGRNRTKASSPHERMPKMLAVGQVNAGWELSVCFCRRQQFVRKHGSLADGDEHAPSADG